MKERTNTMIAEFFERHDNLKSLQAEILQAGEILLKAFQNGNKLLLCGNGQRGNRRRYGHYHPHL